MTTSYLLSEHVIAVSEQGAQTERISDGAQSGFFFF